MAIFLLQPGIQPLGQFDFLDTDLASVLGGEVGTFDVASRTNTSTEKAAADSLDGYISAEIDTGSNTTYRPVVRLADHGVADGYKLMYLLDDGKANYGTLFGEVIGTPVGLLTTGTNIGPHTAQGSGKVTLWDKAGLYGVSLDAVHAGDTGVPNSELAAGADTPLPGDLLYRHSTNAKLARGMATGVTAGDRNGNKVAVFIEMSAAPSLVTTPGRLVGATDSYDRIVVQYLGCGCNMGAAQS